MEFFDSALHFVFANKMLEVLANLLVEALADGAELLPGAFDKLFVNGESDIHEHSICAHIYCVKKKLRAE
jgi:hypothetical protein